MKKNKRIILLFLICIFVFFNSAISPAIAGKKTSNEKSLSLKECVRFALENSFEVKLARLDLLIKKSDLGIAEAVFDTSLFANIGYADDKRETLSVFSGHTKTNPYLAGVSKRLPSGTELTFSLSETKTESDSPYVSQNPAHTVEASLEMRQPIGRNFFGLSDRADILTSKLAIQNADLDTKERIESLIAEVERAYWDWVFSKKNLSIFRQIRNKAKKLHQSNVKNYDIGRIEKGDFLASEANVLIRETDLAIAENRYHQSEEKIKLLMNMDSRMRIKPADDLKYRKTEAALENLLKTAFQKRRDYQKAQSDLEIKNIKLKIKINNCWPEIDLVATMAANGVDRDFNEALGDISGGHNYYFSGVEISIPIENNKAKSRRVQAGYDKEKAVIEIKSIERTIITEVGNAFRSFVTYKSNLSKLIKAAQLQKEKLKEEEKRFNYGRSNTKRLIDYQQDELRSELEVSLGLLAYENSRINLKKSINIILEKYEDAL